ncbi:hypothetical protein KW471_07890 [Vibrio fluvialis]|nr:hypothetical protein [Vibrio fluvialis]
MNKKTLLLFFLANICQASDTNFDIWKYSEHKDEFSNIYTYEVMGRAGTISDAVEEGKFIFYPNNFYQIGLRCDENKTKDLMLIFNVKDTIATPNSNVVLQLKSDNNPPLSFNGRLFSNSYRGGYIKLSETNSNDFSKAINQFKKSNNLKVRISDIRKSSVIDYEVSLSGFTKTSKKLLTKCYGNVKPEKNSYLIRIDEINKQIKALEKEKEELLSYL